MVNAYDQLGIAPCLRIGRDQLNAAFREAGKRMHPDAGGNEKAFAQLQLAHEILQSPAKRLRHWLQLKGVEVESRGTVGSGLMTWFSKVGDVSQRAEALIRKREAAKSVLAKALLEGETHLCREAVEQAIAELEQELERSCEAFDALESASEISVEFACELQRELSFLEKWRATLRGFYGRLL